MPLRRLPVLRRWENQRMLSSLGPVLRYLLEFFKHYSIAQKWVPLQKCLEYWQWKARAMGVHDAPYTGAWWWCI